MAQIYETLLKSADTHYSRKLNKTERAFIRDYYHRLPEDDYSPVATSELIDAALKHREFASVRQTDETLVALYNVESSLTDPEPCTVVNIVNDDRPFLVDTLTILLNNLNITIHRTIHPVFQVKRSKSHQITAIRRVNVGEDKPGSLAESFIQFHVDYVPESGFAELESSLRSVIEDVKIVVADWSPSRERLLSLAVELENNRAINQEYSRLLRWLENHHFALLGYCELTVSGSASKPVVRLDRGSALGYMRALGERSGSQIREFLPPVEQRGDRPVTITKSRERSTIHRPAFMDAILVSRPRERGRSQRVSCILGLFTSAAFVEPTHEIPLLREKTEWILQRSTLRLGSYAYKALQMLLESLPRELLFQMNRKPLFKVAMDVLNHQERRKTRVYITPDQCGHFYSCLVYVPRDLFNSDMRRKIQDYLSDELQGREVLFDVYFSGSILTRIHFVVHTRTGKPIAYDPVEIEAAIQVIARDWNDSLRARLSELHDTAVSRDLMRDYTDAFSEAYRDDFHIDHAVGDIECIEAGHDEGINSKLYRVKRDGDLSTRLKLYSPGQQVPLSDILPILENLGLRVIGERPYRVRRKLGKLVWIHDFEIVRQDGAQLNIDKDADNLRQTLHRVWQGDAENDGFNQLILDTGLNWRQVVILRACFRYLKQIRLRYSQDYVIQALVGNRAIVMELAEMFTQRFDPELTGKRDDEGEKRIAELLQQVESLDEDRILCAMRDVVTSILRTNYYQLDKQGQPAEYLSFKIDSSRMPRLPDPRPRFEIFVYSPRVEGIHLRGGLVARGGLRWSDRLEDYRTEVLGLVKAQMVKNAVIVPVGSKGGFVPRHLPEGDRDAIQAEVIACYQLFISGLLDLTDNLVGDRIVPPAKVVRYDGDDPYLVVAADKGTASFSDIANEISEARDFWLGDAFASGGSMGYDHKAMGITARGAWESVKRLFRERGKNIQREDFTVLGIGDMSGDVFGNGMLLSRHIRLQAAFNHLHIFIDPAPDAARSYRERKRLFNRKRSSWEDYNQALISSGGGVFSRKAKSIKLTPEIKKMLDTGSNQCSPDELINLLLKMPVELLWNGGIGTYVKASTESHTDAQDKTNDGLRVDANELRCAVIGEGGNLGVTQKARVEFCRLGGLCNTDAIDNSAGVDTSDHEVNIKVLFNRAEKDGQLDRNQRNRLLDEMEASVAELVLKNNYTQTQAISLASHYSKALLAQHINALNVLEARGLNREIEYLPDEAGLAQRMERGEGLARPELSVLLAYSKMDLYNSMLDSDLPDEPALTVEIDHYFPEQMREPYQDYIRSHRLRREIIATHLTNRLVGQMGPAFHLRQETLLGAGAAEIARAWFVVQQVMKTDLLVQKIEALDNRVDATVQLECLYEVTRVVEKNVRWILRQYPDGVDVSRAVTEYAPRVAEALQTLDSSLSEEKRAQVDARSAQLETYGIGKPLARELARVQYLAAALEIAGISIDTSTDTGFAGAIYFRVLETFRLGWSAMAIDRLPVDNTWHERAQLAMANYLVSNHARICGLIIAIRKRGTPEQRFETWLEIHRADVERIRDTAEQLSSQDNPDFAMLSVLVGSLSQLA